MDSTKSKAIFLLKIGFRFDENRIMINGRVEGTIENNGHILQNGSLVGIIQSDGNILINGRTIGKIENNGNVFQNGVIIGAAPGVKMEYVALIFFFDFFK